VTCSRRYAALLALVLALAATVAAWGARTPQQPDRELGYGQIRFQGVGPERWAQRYRQERARVWALRGALTLRVDRLVALIRAFECIHRFEGAWTDPGAPYYGGLQMDWTFMHTYGQRLLQSRGTADHWTPAQQIATAIVAHTSRGFAPWPNTARMCGLK
jgi:hypothetical protein